MAKSTAVSKAEQYSTKITLPSTGEKIDISAGNGEFDYNALVQLQKEFKLTLTTLRDQAGKASPSGITVYTFSNDTVDLGKEEDPKKLHEAMGFLWSRKNAYDQGQIALGLSNEFKYEGYSYAELVGIVKARLNIATSEEKIKQLEKAIAMIGEQLSQSKEHKLNVFAGNLTELFAKLAS